MSVILYYGSGSPYAWRAWAALEYKKVPYEQHILSFDAGDLETPAFTALNPRQKVPVLVDGKFTLCESAAIVEYVEERWPQAPRLFAADLQQRGLQRQTIREIDGYVAPALTQLAQTAIFVEPGKRNDTAVAAAATAMRQELAQWELGGNYLSGELSAVDFTLYPFVALVQRFAPRLPGAPKDLLGPKLTAWAARMTALPVIQATWPPHWK